MASREQVLEWIKRRTAADAPMVAASEARDAEPGSVEDPEGTTEVTAVLTRDHNQVRALLQQLETVPGRTKGGSPAQMSQRKSIVDMITVDLSRHESVEEEHFWPAVRGALHDGDQRAEATLRQEQEGKETLAALGKLEGDSEGFDDLVEELTLRAGKHVAFEEKVFLEIGATMAKEERDELGAKLAKAERRAPTRPHPHAPQSPRALKVAGAGAAGMDKVRDALGSRPAERKGKAESAKSSPGRRSGEAGTES